MTEGPPDASTHWRRINDVFHQALARPESERHAFVRETCAEDAAVCAEVLSLLGAHDRAVTFLDRPAGSSAAVLDALAPAPTTGESLVGRQIGHYRIQRTIGAGGMGVVYLAEDVRLGRTVALKVLPPPFAGDAARRERLRREARAAAGLTHPGVATVYALEDIDGQVFITSEYVPGETLREELARGPLSPARVLDTAIGIADALAAAHDRGVVHRDLKPENLIRTPAGQIKILDFGLARLRDVPDGDAGRLTGDGTFVGTPAYMSPEQIRHEAVDGRSDLFAVGIILYELLAGVHPFAGANPSSTIARILESDPARISVGGAPAAVGHPGLGDLEAIVRTCLAKVPSARFASAHDLRAALERVRDGLPASADKAADRRASTQAATGDPVWWWQFHQVATAIGYAVLLAPLWPARAWIGGRVGLAVVIAGIVGAVTAVILRLHLWFTLRSYPSEWARQRDHNGRWIRAADVLFVAALTTAGVWIVDAQPEWAALFIGAAVVALLSFLIIEPATTRAARL